jgi:hypothetical protein
MVLAIVITFAAGMTWLDTAVAGEKFKLRTVKYATNWQQIEISDVEGHIINVHDAVGIITNMEGKSFGDGWVMRHFGFGDGNPQGDSIANGYEEVTDKDGDKFYSKYEGKPVGEYVYKGDYTIIKGTGKYEGIKGKGTWTAYIVAPFQWYTDEEWDIELP